MSQLKNKLDKAVGLVKTMDDLEKMAYLLPDPEKFCSAEFALVDKYLGDEGMVEVRPHQGVDHLLVDSLGFENALTMLYDDPELFKAAMPSKSLAKTAATSSAQPIPSATAARSKTSVPSLRREENSEDIDNCSDF